MKPALTTATFDYLLTCLDSNREQAGERYEELRRTLTRFFEWRGAPFPDEHTDEVFNRVARKLSDGVAIRNMGSYCYEVARLICLEAMKSHDSKRTSLDSSHHEVATATVGTALDEHELRLNCLEECLDALPTDSRDLIVEYYQDEKRNRIERRKALAVKLGLQREALANRAQRLRDRLEQCVRRCISKK
jgi:DNA-directed RNA polymerase specialized sigma24 family protein